MMQLRWLIIVSCFSVLIAPSAWADSVEEGKDTSRNLLTERLRESQHPQRINEIPYLHDIAQPAKTVEQWLSQTPSVIEVTDVSVSVTDFGLDVILDTSAELTPVTSVIGNTLIADIPNAVLALPNAQDFQQIDPVAEIASVSVTNLPNNYVRVAITGVDAPPTADVIAETQSLVLSVTPGLAEAEEEIQIVVTGEQDGYFVPDASTATRTDTPLRDIPQSIQVVPQQVLRDQQAVRLEDALQNVSGVTQITPRSWPGSDFAIRGFRIDEFSFFGTTLRDGLQDPVGTYLLELTSVDRVEVLKGPSSVLFGSANPGGTINIITKQPLPDPFYELSATVGSYDFYRGAIDLTGPLNDSQTVLYRLNASYRSAGSFIDFVENQNISIAPVLDWRISDNTSLTFSGEYLSLNSVFTPGQPAVGTILPNPNGAIARNLYIGEPDSDFDQNGIRVRAELEHQFSDNWSLRSAFGLRTYRETRRDLVFPDSLSPDNRTLNRRYGVDFNELDIYSFVTDIVGKFSTGSVEHQLLLGTTLARIDFIRAEGSGGTAPPLDLFNPVYGQPLTPPVQFYDSTSVSDSLGVYIQDQVTITDNLKLLLGLRFDAFEQTNRDLLEDSRTNQSGNACSPRVGIVYQPVEPLSLYASYSRSFTPTIGLAFDGSQFEPGRGTQYEIGVKADLNDQLSATLALYDLTRSNVLTDDPVNPNFSIQTGEQRSRGVELNLTGEVLPGWNIFAGYAYTDATVTDDTDSSLVGNFLNNVPENSFNLWTTYEIQAGALQGFGVGVGLFFVGERQGDLANTFQLPSYLRTDAAIFYNRDQFQAQINFKNLFDMDYFTGAFSNLRVFRGEPFTIQGTISWQF
ncbi:TonB-dependent siderophore receptor [Gloeocapsa sp. PCC 7428]|uniref:TonB-dependent siderophore receptor n=1 Tax=Gloeocapsa sp. PCC 7428 TaxID=1173026 RepID=UPI0012DC0F3B|nr:TonB-dependent siderophore receptor [Gloeocapsa sp. PCC 7428]